jgi:ankyrin repeat protein
MYSVQYGTIDDRVRSLMARRPEFEQVVPQVRQIFEQFAKLPSLHDAILERLVYYGRGGTADETTRILQDTLSNTHQGILESLMETLPEKKQHIIRHIFMCIQCAAEPLTVEILAKATELSFPLKTWTDQFGHNRTHEKVSKILDKHLRGIILWEGRNVRFSDDRFYDVSLGERGIMSGEQEWICHSHAHMATVCLLYLLGSEGEEMITALSVQMQGMDDLSWSPVALPRHSFVSYALRFWIIHYRAAGDLRPVNLARELFQTQEKRRLWAEAVYVISNPFTRTQKEYMSPIPYMSMFGLDDLVHDFLQSQTRHHGWNQDIWLAIAEAARNGHGKLVTLLLEHADIDATGLGEALHWAANYGQGGALDCLVSKAQEFQGFRWPPFILNRAVAAGLEKLVSALIRAGYDLNEEDSTGARRAIHTAIETGQDHMLKLLLDSGSVDLGLDNHAGGSPLVLAVKVGNPESIRHLLGLVNNSEAMVDRLLLQAITHANHEALAILIDAHIHANRDIVNKIYDDDQMLIPVVEAAKRGFKGCTRVLLDRGADPNAVDGDKSALHHAIGVAPRGDIHAMDQAGPFLDVCLLLLKKGANPNQHESQDPAYQDKSMLLMRAVERESKPLIAMLLDHGASLNSADPNRTGFDTPLAWAIEQHTTPEIASLLLERGADPNFVSEDCWSPLFTACYRQRDVSFIESLIKHGADIHWTRKEDGWSVFHAAYDQHQTLAVLLANGADINITDDNNWTVLMLAAANNERKSVEFLLKQTNPKANVETESDDDTSSTALNLACQSGRADTMKFLVEAGANINHQTSSGRVPLSQFLSCDPGEYMAVFCEKPVEYMLEQRPDVSLSERWSHQTVLHNIKKWTPLSVVISIVEAGAPVGVVDTSGRTCLAVAIEEGNIDAARYLTMIKGVRTEMNLRHFVCPLHLASKSSTLELVKHLVRAGADPSIVEPKSTESLLYSAIGNKDRTECQRITRYLVEEVGVDVNGPGGRLRFPLLRAVDETMENSMLRYLLDHRAHRDAVDKLGRNVAHFLVARDNSARHRKKFAKDVDTLVKDWAEFSVVDHYGRTPLHLAAATGDRATVQFILEKLAASRDNFNVDIADVDGWTPLMWACRRDDATVADLLVDEYKANISVRSNDLVWSPLKIARYYSWPDHSIKMLVPRARSQDRKESRFSQDDQTKPGFEFENLRCRGCNTVCPHPLQIPSLP